MPQCPVVITPANAPHAPTSELREKVKYMVACGLEVPQIAFLLECTPFEVQFHYKDELAHGLALVNANVGMKMLEAINKGDMQSAQYWLKTRAHWIVPTKVEMTGENGGPISVEHKVRRQLMDDIVELFTQGKRKEAEGLTNAKTPASSRRMQ